LKLFLFVIFCPSPNVVWSIVTFVVRPFVEITTARRNKSSYSFWIIVKRKENLEFCYYSIAIKEVKQWVIYINVSTTILQITLQPTWKRDDTEEPGESGGNSGGPDVADIFFYLNNSSERIDMKYDNIEKNFLEISMIKYWK